MFSNGLMILFGRKQHENLYCVYGELLSNLRMLSVNQMNAQIKTTEAWKASQDRAYPLKIGKVKKLKIVQQQEQP